MKPGGSALEAAHPVALKTGTAALIGLLLLLAACTNVPAPERPVTISIHDYKISASTPRVSAGPVTFSITNVGPSMHEFNVDRTGLGASELPIGPDGISVDEDSPDLQRVGLVDGIDIEGRATLTLRLAPGHYVFYCNLEGHYLAGMHFSFDVGPRTS